MVRGKKQPTKKESSKESLKESLKGHSVGKKHKGGQEVQAEVQELIPNKDLLHDEDDTTEEFEADPDDEISIASDKEESTKGELIDEISDADDDLSSQQAEEATLSEVEENDQEQAEESVSEASEESEAESEKSEKSTKSDKSTKSQKSQASEVEECMYTFAKNKKHDGEEEEEEVEEPLTEELEEEKEKIVVNSEDRITKPIWTEFEIARAVSVRAKQLSIGAKPMLKGVENYSPIEIAILELKHGVLPLIIERPLPNNKFEHWYSHELTLTTDIDETKFHRTQTL